jgi:hypothetical protein
MSGRHVPPAQGSNALMGYLRSEQRSRRFRPKSTHFLDRRCRCGKVLSKKHVAAAHAKDVQEILKS